MTWSTASSTHMPISRAPIATIAVADPDPAHGPPRLQRAHAPSVPGSSNERSERPSRWSSSERSERSVETTTPPHRWSSSEVSTRLDHHDAISRDHPHAGRSRAGRSARGSTTSSRRQGTASLACGGLDCEPLPACRGGFGAEAALASCSALRQRADLGEVDVLVTNRTFRPSISCRSSTIRTFQLASRPRTGGRGRNHRPTTNPNAQNPCGIRGLGTEWLSVAPA